LNVDPLSGAISDFTITRTVPFTDMSGAAFNGLNPGLLNGNAADLGNSFDPEGLVVAANGNFFVADEYGPSVYEFDRNGVFVRAFVQPSNVSPVDASGPNYVDGRGTILSGRQDNRGYEGLAMSPDGKKLYAVLQDPLVNEGSNDDGRRSGNVRIVEFDVQTGQSTGQYIYQLESLADINARVPGNTFSATAQGRNIGVSAIIALGNDRFLVIERDNRGIGVDDPTGANPVASKRVYEISLAGATDVSSLSLAGTNDLPPGVVPVSKSLHLDVAAALTANSLSIADKLEGLAVGPRLANGSYLLLAGTDNDYSVTQNASGEQFDVCSDGTQVAIDSGCPAGTSLLPGYLYAFADGDLGNYVAPVAIPEPATYTMMAGALALAAVLRRRKA
jgi:hypothetical protein